MGLIDRLRAVRYPIDALEFVDADGTPYVHMPIERVRRALGGKYVYLRRRRSRSHPGRARARARRRNPLRHLACRARGPRRLASTRNSKTAAKTISRLSSAPTACIRACANSSSAPSGNSTSFSASMSRPSTSRAATLPFDRKVKLYQETDRMMFLYPLDERRLDTTYVFRHAEVHGRERPALRIPARADAAAPAG